MALFTILTTGWTRYKTWRVERKLKFVCEIFEEAFPFTALMLPGRWEITSLGIELFEHGIPTQKVLLSRKEAWRLTTENCSKLTLARYLNQRFNRPPLDTSIWL